MKKPEPLQELPGFITHHPGQGNVVKVESTADEHPIILYPPKGTYLPFGEMMQELKDLRRAKYEAELAAYEAYIERMADAKAEAGKEAAV